MKVEFNTNNYVFEKDKIVPIYFCLQSFLKRSQCFTCFKSCAHLQQTHYCALAQSQKSTTSCTSFVFCDEVFFYPTESFISTHAQKTREKKKVDVYSQTHPRNFRHDVNLGINSANDKLKETLQQWDCYGTRC